MLTNNSTSVETNIPKKPGALADWSYEIIKQKILDLEIQPGEQLHIEDFIEKLDISRTPLREALQRLAADGLVEIRPRVGYFVTEIKPQDIRDLFEIREIIEARAVRRAASVLTEEDMHILKEINDASQQAVITGEYEKFLESEIRFHDLLQKHIENKWLIAFVESLKDLTHRQRVISMNAKENVEASVREHQNIIGALLQKDGEKAAWYMAEHLKNVSDRLVILLSEKDDLFRKDTI